MTATVRRTVTLRHTGKMARHAALGDRWRDPDGKLWRVMQVYRSDRQVLLVNADDKLQLAFMADMLREWRWHADRDAT